MTSSAPSRETVSLPLSVSKETLSVPGFSSSNTTKAAARVAWPQRSTSTLGVNQRQAITLALRHQERGLREIVLGRDGLHRCLVQPGVEGADRRRVSAQHAVSEGIDLKQSDRHSLPFHARYARARRFDQVSTARPAMSSAAAIHAELLRRSPKISAPQPGPVSTMI